MCGFVGLKLLFRGLVRLWWYLDLDLLRSVFDSRHGHPDELLASFHGRAARGPRLSPNVQCV